MPAGLASGLYVGALMRRVQQAGGFATVLARGDDRSGAILIIGREKSTISGVWERALTHMGQYAWQRCGPQDIDSEAEIDRYIWKRRDTDPDLWLIELDIPQPARFAAEQDINS